MLDIDIGGFDDPWVLRMFARQDQDGVTYRWIRNLSYVTFARHSGDGAGSRDSARATAAGPGRPRPASVQVFLDDHAVGTVTVQGGFSDYRVALPPGVAADAAARPAPAVVRLVCTTWVPKDVLGGSDDRRLASCSIASGWSRRVLQIANPRERLAVAAADAGLRVAALLQGPAHAAHGGRDPPHSRPAP